MATKRTSAESTAAGIAREISRSEQRSNRRRNRHTVTEALYSDVDPHKLLNAIDNVTRAGCAIQFGYTKDGSAFVVRIVGDGDPYNEFVRPSENFDLYLDGLTEDFSK